MFFCLIDGGDYLLETKNHLGIHNGFFHWLQYKGKLQGSEVWGWASLVAQMVKNLPAMQETQVWSLGQEDTLEKGMAICSSILAWRIPWSEDLGRLQTMGLQRVGHDWETNTHTYTHTHTHTHTHTRCRAVGGRECVVKDSLLNSQLGSCLSPSETASDGFLDRRCLAITACPCHGTFRRIPGDAKSLLRTMASSPTQIQPGSGELHRFESCSVNYLIESQD